MSEKLDVFDENFNLIGQEDRDVIHSKGLWHQTFHCWIVRRHGGKNFVLVQKRAHAKKVAPDMLDISAAGHLLAGETKEDGIRELKEELGIDIDIAKMRYLGIRISTSESRGKSNKEFCHVVLLEDDTPLEDYIMPENEVSGLVEIEVNGGLKLLSGGIDSLICDALFIENGQKNRKQYSLRREDFIPRIDSYYLKIFIMAERYFAGNKYLAI
jgi:isopentenyldiphosphate isomerase